MTSSKNRRLRQPVSGSVMTSCRSSPCADSSRRLVTPQLVGHVLERHQLHAERGHEIERERDEHHAGSLPRSIALATAMTSQTFTAAVSSSASRRSPRRAGGPGGAATGGRCPRRPCAPATSRCPARTPQAGAERHRRQREPDDDAAAAGAHSRAAAASALDRRRRRGRRRAHATMPETVKYRRRVRLSQLSKSYARQEQRQGAERPGRDPADDVGAAAVDVEESSSSPATSSVVIPPRVRASMAVSVAATACRSIRAMIRGAPAAALHAVEHEIDDDPGHRDIHPDRERPSRDRHVPVESPAEPAREGHHRHRQNRRGEHHVREQNREVDDADRAPAGERPRADVVRGR